MKCTNLFSFQPGRKGKLNRVFIRPDWLDMQLARKAEYTQEFAPCQGTLSVSLSVSQGCCCHDESELNVEYTCTECGLLNFIPVSCGDKSDFADFVNALMNTVTSIDHKDSLTLEYERRERRNARVNQLMSEGMTSAKALNQAMREEMLRR